jgi:hypothetical protein
MTFATFMAVTIKDVARGAQDAADRAGSDRPVDMA